MAAPKKKGLGKGLDALFANTEINTISKTRKTIVFNTLPTANTLFLFKALTIF